MSVRDVLDLVGPGVEQVEHIFGWKILVDDKALEECGKKAEETLGHLQGIPAPNTIKIAGHYAFWIRKLKPFSLYRRSEAVALLAGLGVRDAEGIVPPEDEPHGAKTLFVNEIIAIFAACGLVNRYRPAGMRIHPSAGMMNDWIVGLRYHSYSPSSLAILLEGLSQCPKA